MGELQADDPQHDNVRADARPPGRRRPPRWAWVAAMAAVCAAVAAGLVVSLGSGHRAPLRRQGPQAAPARASGGSNGVGSSGDSSVPAETPTAGNLQLAQLQVGDCLTGADMRLNTSDPWPKLTTAVPCSQPHTAEVFFANDTYWPRNLPYPGSNAVTRQGDTQCGSAFRAYVGIAYPKSRYSWTNIIPDASTWPTGDRGLHCLAYYATHARPGGAPMTGSIRGSRR